jgi:hypothetical protein
MAEPFKLTAIPDLLPEGEFKGHLETVTFIAANGEQRHKWWAVNVGTFESDFRKIVSPEMAQHVVEKRKRVIFPTGLVVSCGVMMRPWNVGKL